MPPWDGGPVLGVEVQILHHDVREAEIVLICLAVHELDKFDHLMRPSHDEPKICPKRDLVEPEQLRKMLSHGLTTSSRSSRAGFPWNSGGRPNLAASALSSIRTN